MSRKLVAIHLRPGQDDQKLAEWICTTLQIYRPVGTSHSYIREDGGCLIRVLEAIDGYMSKFGTLPTGLKLGRDVIGPLKREKLTDSGYARLTELFPIFLNQADDLQILATGDSGQVFDYMDERQQQYPLSKSARSILGFETGAK